MSAQSCAEWFAALGVAGAHRGSTLATYRSALSTWRSEELLSDAPNPLLSTAVTRVLKGAQRELRPQEEAQRAAAAPTLVLSAQDLHNCGRFAGVGGGAQPRSLMLWAAANLGVYGLLRPNELLGSPAHPERVPTPAMVVFYAREDSEEVRALCPLGSVWGATPVPDRFTLALGPTKADQAGRNAPHGIAAAPAVRALWRWMHVRRAGGARTQEPLFSLAGEAPLSLSALGAAITGWCQAAGIEPARFTGKSLRRSGASLLTASGASLADLMAQGRWRSAEMPALYSDAGSKRARALRASRAMAPSALPGGVPFSR